MDLTALKARNAERFAAEVVAADITNPDLARSAAVRLITVGEDLLSDLARHAERLQGQVDSLRAETVRLTEEADMLRAQLAAHRKSAPELAAA